MHRVTANAVADRPAETTASAYYCLHARRCYAHCGGPVCGNVTQSGSESSCAASVCFCRADAAQTTYVKTMIARTTLCTLWTTIPIQALRYRFAG
jgi:hypothetical protein